MKQKKILAACLTALIILLAFMPAVSAEVVDPTTEFYVADYAYVIDDDTENYIIAINDSLYEQTGAQIVILLLPDTPATTNTLDARTLALLAPGAFVINPGRGPLIDDGALIAALDNGQVAHATLDVFRTEPLPVSTSMETATPSGRRMRVAPTPLSKLAR